MPMVAKLYSQGRKMLKHNQGPKPVVPKKPKIDEASCKAKYAAYRKRMTVSPDTVVDIIPYSKWKKTNCGMVN